MQPTPGRTSLCRLLKGANTSEYGEKLCSLRLRILGSTLLVLAVAMGVTMFGMWHYHRDRLFEMTRKEALQAGLTIEAGLRTSMLQNDHVALQATIDEMIRVTKVSRINIIDPHGYVALSSDPATRGTVFDRATDPACVACHQGEGGSKSSQAFQFVDGDSGPFLRNIIKVENRPACYGCHPPKQKICGVLMVDASLADIYAILRTSSLRLLATGVISFLVIAVIVSLIVSRFVLQPLQILRDGFVKVGKGDFNFWVDIKGCDELAEMGDSFNIMSRAIGRYIDEVGRKTREFESLYVIVQRMSETIELKKVVEVAVNILHEVVQAECVLVAMSNERDSSRFEMTWRLDDDRRCYWADYQLSDPAPPHGSVCRTDLVKWQQEPMDEPLYENDGCRALLPLQVKGMRFGLICIVKEGGQRFTLADRNLFPTLAQHIAISFANARLYNQAITDELTTLYTKRYFFAKAQELIDEQRRGSGEGFTLMMVDLDHFKKVNDTYGHPVGDKVLALVGELIWIVLRRGDMPCRYGGEEFAILLPGVDLSAVYSIAERLRNYVANYSFAIDGLPVFHKTLSIGLAAFPEHVATVEELVAAADAALYEAKRLGRNQVRLYQPPQ